MKKIAAVDRKQTVSRLVTAGAESPLAAIRSGSRVFESLDIRGRSIHAIALATAAIVRTPPDGYARALVSLLSGAICPKRARVDDKRQRCAIESGANVGSANVGVRLLGNGAASAGARSLFHGGCIAHPVVAARGGVRGCERGGIRERAVRRRRAHGADGSRRALSVPCGSISAPRNRCSRSVSPARVRPRSPFSSRTTGADTRSKGCPIGAVTLASDRWMSLTVGAAARRLALIVTLAPGRRGRAGQRGGSVGGGARARCPGRGEPVRSPGDRPSRKTRSRRAPGPRPRR
jgi:hypothetical protein